MKKIVYLPPVKSAHAFSKMAEQAILLEHSKKKAARIQNMSQVQKEDKDFQRMRELITTSQNWQIDFACLFDPVHRPKNASASVFASSKSSQLLPDAGVLDADKETVVLMNAINESAKTATTQKPVIPKIHCCCNIMERKYSETKFFFHPDSSSAKPSPRVLETKCEKAYLRILKLFNQENHVKPHMRHSYVMQEGQIQANLQKAEAEKIKLLFKDTRLKLPHHMKLKGISKKDVCKMRKSLMGRASWGNEEGELYY